MANKKPTRKMPADVKRTLIDRRTAKQEAKRRAKAPAPPAEPLPFQVEATRDPAEVADNAAVDLFADAMRERLALKRLQGYGGWNDATQCDARKIARLFMDKLFGTADGEDLGNYLAFLHHFGHGGQYALREVIKERIGAIRTEANARADALQKELTQVGEALEHARHVAARSEANLARALGYIDRVTEGEPRVAVDAPVRETQLTQRGPQLDQGEPYRTSADLLMGLRR